MEAESGAKIAIRGKGSVKEGKGRSDAAHSSNQEEDLHCLIMADTEEKVNKAKKLIHNVIETVRIPFPCQHLPLVLMRCPGGVHPRGPERAQT
jgi:splicing factor 1